MERKLQATFFFVRTLPHAQVDWIAMDLGLFAKKGIVCAASKGLGRAVAVALAREGVDLVVKCAKPGRS